MKTIVLLSFHITVIDSTASISVTVLSPESTFSLSCSMGSEQFLMQFLEVVLLLHENILDNFCSVMYCSQSLQQYWHMSFSAVTLSFMVYISKLYEYSKIPKRE